VVRRVIAAVAAVIVICAAAASASAAPATAPAVSIRDLSLPENVGPGVASVRLRLSAAAATVVRVRLATSDGTALAGSDYLALAAVTVRIKAGKTTAKVDIPILNNETPEASEVFTVAITGASGATVADGSATVTIVNDDIDLDEDGYTIAMGDCDDQDPNTHPGATEVAGDDKDNDCDGLVDRDDPSAAGCPAAITKRSVDV
jgi:hypothetical protein